LLTLSDLFAIALWTKLPTPFAGEPGLPNVAELYGMADSGLPAGLNICDACVGSGEAQLALTVDDRPTGVCTRGLPSPEGGGDVKGEDVAGSVFSSSTSCFDVPTKPCNFILFADKSTTSSSST